MSVVVGVSVAHDHARIDEIETASSGEKRRLEDLRLRDPVREAYALETCNRVEAYVVVDDPMAGQEVLAESLPELRADAVTLLDHEESLRHLMRVACGLESLVLGEDQILGQIRDAYETARGVGTLGPTLEEVVTKAIHVGERARTETAINEGSVSLGSAAVELAEAELGDLTSASALVVGAGKMGTLTARALAAAEVEEITVANRTVARAEHVADEVGNEVDETGAVGLDDLETELAAADVAVSATGSPEPVIQPEHVAGASETLLVDIARPRDVAPAVTEREAVAVRDLDSLETVTAETRERRQEAAEAVEAIVDEEFDRLLDQCKRRRADDAIAAMYEGAEYVKETELERAFTRLEAKGELTDEQREVVESLADALVYQLLAAPTKSLREAAVEDDWTTIDTALQLFDPEFDDSTVSEPSGPEHGSPAFEESPDADVSAESDDD